MERPGPIVFNASKGHDGLVGRAWRAGSIRGVVAPSYSSAKHHPKHRLVKLEVWATGHDAGPIRAEEDWIGRLLKPYYCNPSCGCTAGRLWAPGAKGL